MNEYSFSSELETDRLIVRNVDTIDTEFIFRLFRNEGVCEFLYDELFMSRNLWDRPNNIDHKSVNGFN